MSSNSGGNAKAAGYAAAAAKGQAETQAQDQRNAQLKAQQQQQAKEGVTGKPQSRGFDSAGNRLNDQGQIVQFANRQAQESYLSARGVGNTGQVVDQGLFSNADFSQIGNYSNAAKAQASGISANPAENYGYSGGVKVSSIISENFAKNPEQTNFNLEKNRQAEQARRQSRDFFNSDQGGIVTPQSKGKSFGYSWSNKQSESIGSKIFSNQEQLVRGSEKEEQAKQSQAEKAFTSTPQTSNKDYISGGTKQPDYNSVISLGKAQAVFGKTDTGSFGWESISKDQLVRGSNREKALNTTLGARSTFQEGQGKALPFDIVGADQVKNTRDVFNSKPSSSVSVSKQQPSAQPEDFGTFFSGAESRGSNIDIYNQQGAKVGTVKANDQGLQTLQSLGDLQGVYFKESKGSSGYDSSQRRGFADYVSSEAKTGAIINIFSGDQKVGSVSGPNAYRDTIPLQSKFGAISARVDYSTTPEGKTLLDVVSKGGIVSFSDQKTGSIGLLYSGDKNPKSTLNDIASKAPNGFNYSILYPEKEKALLNDIRSNPEKYSNKPESFWSNAYREGRLQPNDISIINDIFHSYTREQNKDFIKENKANAKFIQSVNERNDPSYYFNIKDSSGKVVKTTTGDRSFYDFMRSNLDTKGGTSIDVHFSNTFEAASKREDKLSNKPQEGIEAYGSDVKPTEPQLGGLQAIPRLLEQTGGQYIGGIESAFSHLYEKNKSGETTFPGLHGIPETAKNILTNDKAGNEFSRDIIHTFIPISLTSASKGQIKASNVELTPESRNLENRTAAPNVMGYLMGKEPANPNVSKEYYDIQSAFLIGTGIAGVKSAIPISKSANTILLQKESLTFQGLGKPVIQEKPISAYRGYSIGYDWLGYKDIYGRTPSGRVLGKPTNEQMAPLGYRVVALEQEGSEIANKGNAYTIKKSTDTGFVDYLAKTGRTVQPNAGEILQAIIDKNRVSNTIGHTPSERPFTAGITTDTTVGKGVIAGIVERQGPLAKLDQGKGGQLGEVYGSGLTFSGGSKAAVETLKDFGFEQKDIESSIHPFLGIGKQRKGIRLTSTIYDRILKQQGFIFNPDTKSYEAPRGPENLPPEQQEIYAKEQMGELKYNIAKSASSRGNYIGGSSSQILQFGKKGFREIGDVDIYVKSSKYQILDNLRFNKEVTNQYNLIKDFYSKSGKNPQDVLIEDFGKKAIGTRKHFVRIYDKSTNKSIAEIILRTKPKKGSVIKEDKVINYLGINARKANQVIRDKSFIVKALERKKSSGKKLSPNEEKKLTKAKSDIISARNAEKISTSEMVKSGLIEDYLRTRKEDTKIYSYGKSISGKDVAEGGKIFEIPQLDKDVMSSSGTKGENFFGYKIDKSTHKYPSIVGKSIKGASQVFNKTSQEKKQATLNTKESLSQQGGVTKYHTDIIGNKVFLGEAVYSGGKALARGSVLELDDAMRLISNPSTREEGFTHLKNIDIVGKGQSFLYGIDWNKFKTTYFEKRGEQVPDIIKADDTYYQYVNQITGGKPISSFKPTSTSKSISGGGPSSYPGRRIGSKSVKTGSQSSLILGSSNRSIFTSKSNNILSGDYIGKSNISNISSKSSKSQFSGRSNIYGVSSRSGPSGKSAPSGKSSPSNFSSFSSISEKSSPSGKSILSSFSGLSGPSGKSAPSGISGPSGKSGVSGFSGFSGFSGSSGYSGYNSISTPPPHISGYLIGNLGKRKKAKQKEGPTALKNLNVRNIFASTFDINVSKSRRYEF